MISIESPNCRTVEEVNTYLGKLIEALDIAINSLDREMVIYRILHRVPTKPREGMLVYADGTDWNPGSGAGLYKYDGANWDFIG